MDLSDRSNRYRTWIWFLVLLGSALRIREYLFNRSLWLDEAALANNILSRSYAELLRPLDYNQGAPLGFLFTEKLMTQLLGSSEFALRLLPMLLSIASLLLFAALAQRFLRSQGALVAVGLCAISEWLIYYSSEAKQYSGDVAVAILLYWVTDRRNERIANSAPLGFLAVIGGLALWFSHPAFFLLAGIGLGNVLLIWQNKEWNKLGRLFTLFSAWGISFGILYAISLKNLSNSGTLLRYWSTAFAPFPPKSFHDIRWYLEAFFGALDQTRGDDLAGTGIAALAFLLGCAAFFVRNRARFGVLVFPALVTLAVSMTQKYPFGGRLLLFLVPSTLLLIGEGTQELWEYTRTIAPLRIIFVILLFLDPVWVTARGLVKPHVADDPRSVVQYLGRHLSEGNVLYIDYTALISFKYYGPREGLGKLRPIIGKEGIDDLAVQGQNLDQLRGQGRVWVLLSHSKPAEADFIRYYLDSMGRRLDSFESLKSSVYYYDLSARVR